MKRLGEQDLYDILLGCTVLGTGGGGKLDEGLEMIGNTLKKGYEFRLVSLEEIPQDALIASPFNAGSVSPLSEKEKQKFKDFVVDKSFNVNSFRALEEYLGQKFYATVPTELGGSNTAIALSVAAELDIFIVDGDPSGRSVPELQQSMFEMNNIPINPFSMTTKFGDTIIIKDVINGTRAEDIVRAVAVASQNIVGVTNRPVLGKDIRKSIIPGTVSYALRIGKALREAEMQGKDLFKEVVKVGKGYILFKGLICNFNWSDEGGFTVGKTCIEGIDEYSGDNYKIWYKNENLVSWRNGEAHVTGPDLISIFNTKTGTPITNPYFEKGMEVTIIGLPAPKEWRTELGIASLGPMHFGFDIEYRPIEEIMK